MAGRDDAATGVPGHDRDSGPAPRLDTPTRVMTKYAVFSRVVHDGQPASIDKIEDSSWEFMTILEARSQAEARRLALTPDLIDFATAGHKVYLSAVANWDPQPLVVEQPPPKITI